jgi:hypothetical protein
MESILYEDLRSACGPTRRRSPLLYHEDVCLSVRRENCFKNVRSDCHENMSDSCVSWVIDQ